MEAHWPWRLSNSNTAPLQQPFLVQHAPNQHFVIGGGVSVENIRVVLLHVLDNIVRHGFFSTLALFRPKNVNPNPPTNMDIFNQKGPNIFF